VTSNMRPPKRFACRRAAARMARNAPLRSRASRTDALARLMAVGVVAVVCAAGFGAETQAATQIYIHDITSVPKLRPSRIILTNHAAVSRLRWSTYGGTRATAAEKLNLVQCEPTCAEGTSVKYRTRITVSAPRTCEKKRYYTKIRVLYRSSGVWRPARLTASTPHAEAAREPSRRLLRQVARRSLPRVRVPQDGWRAVLVSAALGDASLPPASKAAAPRRWPTRPSPATGSSTSPTTARRPLRTRSRSPFRVDACLAANPVTWPVGDPLGIDIQARAAQGDNGARRDALICPSLHPPREPVRPWPVTQQPS
jgi:hypothetical protein